MSTVKTPPESGGHQEFSYLDGMRGIAALYVAVFHAISILPMQNLTLLTQFIRDITVQGKVAVAVFITLSGFVLALPYVRGGLDRWDWSRFIKRRSRRLLPPYYFAMLLSIPYCIAFRYFQHQSMVHPKMLLSFLTLQYLDGSGQSTINGPHWTVGVEYLIYIIYGLIYFPVWRRLGIYPMLLMALFLSIAPLIFCQILSLKWYYPWYYPSYFGLFALGVFTSWLCASTTTKKTAHASVFVITIIFFYFLCNSRDLPDMFYYDYISGIYTCVFIFLVFIWKNKLMSLLKNIIDNKITKFMGRVSYSVYLVHYPIVSVSAYFFKKFLSGDMLYLTQFFFAIVASLGLGYVFHVFCERPFLNPPTQQSGSSTAK